VPLVLERQFELGADAVGRGDQHRLAVALGNLEQRSKSAQPAYTALAIGAAGDRFDCFNEVVTGIDVNTGITIGQLGFDFGQG
jgi:hypothetical protein